MIHEHIIHGRTHCCGSLPNTIIARSQQQRVHWGSIPVNAMKQLELLALGNAGISQPSRLCERPCSSSRSGAGGSKHVAEAALSGGLTGGFLGGAAAGGASLINARAVQRVSHETAGLEHAAAVAQQTYDTAVSEQAAAGYASVGYSSGTAHEHHGSTPQQLRARLHWMQAKQQKHRHSHKQQQQQASTLRALLVEHQRAHLQRQQQPDAAGGPELAADCDRLDRKLTAVLTECCSSWNDVAAVLLAADSAGRLNGVHLAAALATLVRLNEAEKANQSTFCETDVAGDGPVGRVAITVVPVTRGQARQLRHVRRAASAAVAAGFVSRWHVASTHLAAPAATTGALPAVVADQPGVDHSVAAAVRHEEEVAAGVEDQQQQLLDELCQAVADHWPLMSAATMTSCCWSLASFHRVLPQSLLPQVGQVLLDMAQQLSYGMATQHSSRGGGGSSSNSNSNHSHGGGVDTTTITTTTITLTRQLVVLLWSLAKMSVEPQDLQQDSKQQRQGSEAQQWEQVEEVLVVDQVVRVLSAHSQQLSSQGLVMLWWALAVWNSCLTPKTAEALLETTAAYVVRQSFNSRGLAVTVWAVARLRLSPDAAWLAAWLAAMRAALPAANSHDCAVSAWALARLGVPPPGEWLAALCWRAAAVARQLRPQELPALLWGLCRLRFRPSLHVVQALLQRGLVLAGRGSLSPQGLALTLWAAAGLGLQPKAVWTDALLAAAGDYLPLFRAVECSALLVALVRLQHIPHQTWMDIWWQETQAKLAAADGQQLVLLLWCAVQLGQAPPASWFAEWKTCSMRAMAAGGVTAQGYGLIWHTLLQLEVSPGSSWLDIYWQASSTAEVLQTLDFLTAERTLVGLAALAQQQQGSFRPPTQWMIDYLAATQRQLVSAKMVNICAMLQAAGQLQMLLPGSWLCTAMDRLAVLLRAEGVTFTATASNSSSSSGSSVPGGSSHHARMAGSASKSHVSYNLAARLRRRWLAVRLKQALEGLRAQQMLARAAPAAAAGQRGKFVLQAGPSAAAGRGYVVDALATWPWLSEAVLATWPNRVSAMQALQGLTGMC